MPKKSPLPKFGSLPGRTTDMEGANVKVLNLSVNDSADLASEPSVPRGDAAPGPGAMSSTRSAGGREDRKVRDQSDIVLDHSNRLGEGAEGQVFLGKVPKLDNKPVAVKIIRGCPSGGSSTAPPPRGDNIVKMYSIFYDPNATELWIVMELMDQGTIRDLFDRHNKLMNLDGKQPVHRLFPKVVAAIAYQCLQGLKSLHEGAMLHRDVKPDNFLVNKKGEVKLSDFGNVRMENTMGEAKTFCGTSCYLSPERLDGKPYSNKGDIWGMGILLLEVAICRGLFRGLHDQVFRLMDEVAGVPSAMQHYGLCEDLLGFLQEMLQHDPDKRPSAAELLSRPFITNNVHSSADALSHIKKWCRAMKTRKVARQSIPAAVVALAAASAVRP